MSKIATEAEIPPGEQIALRLSEPFVQALAKAVETYGDDVVFWAWRTFFVQFLPFAAVLLKEQVFDTTRKQYNLTDEQTMDAISLLGNLRTADDPHKAWLAAEILYRSCSTDAIKHLHAAIALPPPGAKRV